MCYVGSSVRNRMMLQVASNICDLGWWPRLFWLVSSWTRPRMCSCTFALLLISSGSFVAITWCIIFCYVARPGCNATLLKAKLSFNVSFDWGLDTFPRPYMSHHVWNFFRVRWLGPLEKDTSMHCSEAWWALGKLWPVTGQHCGGPVLTPWRWLILIM